MVRTMDPSGTAPVAASAVLHLAAGPLTLEFDTEIAFVRYVRLGDTEVLRGIHVAVRDPEWNTVAPRISELHVVKADRAFEVRFTAECILGDVDYLWKGTLSGAADGTLRFAMDGVARSTFMRNRIGLCILHPLKECAGQPATVETSTGVIQGEFSLDIAPHQPFKDVRAISHEVLPGVRAEVRFEGDVFETEDHRNWSDANFKTYSTPLHLPMPVRVEQGTAIYQSVTVRLLQESNAVWPKSTKGSRTVRLEPAGDERRIPLIGFGAPDRKLTTAEQNLLSALRPAHLRVELCLYESAWRSDLRAALDATRAAGAKLECAITVDNDADEQFQALQKELPEAGITRQFVFHKDESSTGARWVKLARRSLHPSLCIGGGTRNHFVDINRRRPPVDLIDAVCYSAHPQVHAWDEITSVENLEGLAHTVRSARKFIGTKWLAVGPVTVGVRTQTRTDDRQRSPFGCAWTLGSVIALAEAGADSATYYDFAGPNGLVDGGEALPLYNVFRNLAQYAGGFMTPVRSTEPLAIGAMFLRHETRRKLFRSELHTIGAKHGNAGWTRTSCSRTKSRFYSGTARTYGLGVFLYAHGIPERAAESFERDLHHVAMLECYFSEAERSRPEEVNVRVSGLTVGGVLKMMMLHIRKRMAHVRLRRSRDP